MMSYKAPFIRRREADAAVSEARGGFWAIANAPFTIFVLTSIVLAALSAGFSWMQDYYTQKRTNDAEVSRLVTEVAGRVARLSLVVQTLRAKYADPSVQDHRKTPPDLYWILASMQAVDHSALLSDFGGDNLASLLLRIQSHSNGSDNPTQIRAARAALSAAILLQSETISIWEPNVRCTVTPSAIVPEMTSGFTSVHFIAAELAKIEAQGIEPIREYMTLIAGEAVSTLESSRANGVASSFAEFYCQHHRQLPY